MSGSEDEAAQLADLLQRMDRDELVRRIEDGPPLMATVLQQLARTPPASAPLGPETGDTRALVQAIASARTDVSWEPAIATRHHRSGLGETAWDRQAR